MHWSFIILLLLAARTVFAIESPSSVEVAIQNINVKASLEKWQKLSEYILKQHQMKLTLHIENQSDKLKSMVREDRIDLFMDTLVPLLAIDERNQLEPTFVAWRSGVKEYDGCLVTRQDQELSLKDLPGKIIGFEDPVSTSSFALPFSTIVRGGHPLEALQLVELAKLKRKNNLRSEKEALTTMRRDAHIIHYVFTGTDETSIHWLKRGFLDAAGMSCNSAGKNKDLKVIARSPLVPRALVSLRRDLDKDLKEKIIAAFENMPEGHPALAQIGKVAKISRLKEEETAALNELTPVLRKILEKARKDQHVLDEGAY